MLQTVSQVQVQSGLDNPDVAAYSGRGVASEDLERRSVVMAKTRRGKKKVYVKPHKKRVGCRTVRIPEHYRSTPN